MSEKRFDQNEHDTILFSHDVAFTLSSILNEFEERLQEDRKRIEALEKRVNGVATMEQYYGYQPDIGVGEKPEVK